MSYDARRLVSTRLGSARLASARLVSTCPASARAASAHLAFAPLASILRVLAAVVVLGILAACGGESRPDDLGAPQPSDIPLDSVFAYETDVPYVATPQPVVRAMLDLAAVAADDVVYDLGSGDGRIVLTAVQQYGARGVGVELVPELVRQSREHASLAGASDRATFRRADLFTVDLAPATVVTLYLLPDVMQRLRPKLQRELDPGDRVVAHNYTFQDWPPDDSVAVDDHDVYLWRVGEEGP